MSDPRAELLGMMMLRLMKHSFIDAWMVITALVCLLGKYEPETMRAIAVVAGCGHDNVCPPNCPNAGEP